jgi:hypothetical protein
MVFMQVVVQVVVTMVAVVVYNLLAVREQFVLFGELVEHFHQLT